MEDNLGQIEFKISRSYIKSMLIVAVLITSSVIYLVSAHTDWMILEKILLCLIPFSFFGIYLFHLWKYRLVVNNKTIAIKSLFNNQSTPLALLGDYSFQKEGIVINTSYDTDFTISPPLEEQSLFIEWLSHHSQNPELEKETQLYIAAQEELKNNVLFGKNPVALAAKLQKARYVTYVLNGVAVFNFFFTFYCIFFAKISPYPIIISILLPLLCLFVIYYFKGLIIIGINSDKLMVYPNLAFPLGLSLLSCLYPLFSNTYLFDKFQFLFYDFILVLLLVPLSLFISKEVDFKKIKELLYGVAILICGGLVYGYGTLSFLNEYKDDSALQEFRVEVLKKRMTDQKDATYHITLSPWYQTKTAEEIEVKKRFYNSIQEEDSVSVLLSPGNLGFEYYWLEK